MSPFFSRRSSSFFRVLIGLQAMPSILGYSTYRIQVRPGTRTQDLQHQFGKCIRFARSRFFSLPAFRLWAYSTSLQESQEKEVG